MRVVCFSALSLQPTEMKRRTKGWPIRLGKRSATFCGMKVLLKWKTSLEIVEARAHSQHQAAVVKARANPRHQVAVVYHKELGHSGNRTHADGVAFDILNDCANLLVRLSTVSRCPTASVHVRYHHSILTATLHHYRCNL